MEELKLWFDILGGITAFVLFIIAFKKYRKDQIWKRKEFVSNEVKEFLDNKEVQNCLLMFDWGYRSVELYPDHPEYEKRFAKIGRMELTFALLPHGKFKKTYTRDEAAVRDNMDYFMDRLTRFEHFIQSGLIEESDIYPYLRYWIDLMSIELPEPLKSTFHHYVKVYEYKDVINLFERFERKILPELSLEEVIADLNKRTSEKSHFV